MMIFTTVDAFHKFSPVALKADHYSLKHFSLLTLAMKPANNEFLWLKVFNLVFLKKKKFFLQQL